MNNSNSNLAKAIPYSYNDRRGVFYNSHQLPYSSKKQSNLIKRKQEKLSHMLILICASIILTFCLFFCIFQFSKGNVASTHASESNGISYVSVQVTSGDNLWSISKKNKSTMMTTKQYMNEIIQLNQLNSDELQTGNYLLLPIYK